MWHTWGQKPPKHFSGYEDTGIQQHFSHVPSLPGMVVSPVATPAEEKASAASHLQSTPSGRLSIEPVPFAGGAHGQVHGAIFDGEKTVFKRTSEIGQGGGYYQNTTLSKLHKHYPRYFKAMYFSPRRGANPRFYGYVLADLGVSLEAFLQEHRDLGVDQQKQLVKLLIPTVFAYNTRAKLVHGDLKPGNITIQPVAETEAEVMPAGDEIIIMGDITGVGKVKVHLIDVENSADLDGYLAHISGNNVTPGFFPPSWGMQLNYSINSAYMDRYALAMTLLYLFDNDLFWECINETVMPESLIVRALKKHPHPLAKVSKALIEDRYCERDEAYFIGLVDYERHCCCVIC